jgi:hypothetical protein
LPPAVRELTAVANQSLLFKLAEDRDKCSEILLPASFVPLLYSGPEVGCFK